MIAPSFAPKEKRQVILTKKLCLNCLGSHLIAECRNKKRCLRCNGHHHTTLHSSSVAPTTSGTSYHASISIASLTPPTLPLAFVSHQASAASDPVLLATTLVHVHDYQGARQLVRALIDQGSEKSFISDALVRKLKSTRSPASVQIDGIGGVRATRAQASTTNKLSSRVDPRFCTNVNTLILPRVTEYQPSVQTTLAVCTRPRHLFRTSVYLIIRRGARNVHAKRSRLAIIRIARTKTLRSLLPLLRISPNCRTRAESFRYSELSRVLFSVYLFISHFTVNKSIQPLATTKQYQRFLPTSAILSQQLSRVVMGEHVTVGFWIKGSRV